MFCLPQTVAYKTDLLVVPMPKVQNLLSSGAAMDARSPAILKSACETVWCGESLSLTSFAFAVVQRRPVANPVLLKMKMSFMVLAAI
jgi:hypothetical protein